MLNRRNGKQCPVMDIFQRIPKEGDVARTIIENNDQLKLLSINIFCLCKIFVQELKNRYATAIGTTCHRERLSNSPLA
jgi:hypothetical protein